MYLIDAHEDLAYNALQFGRSYLRSAADTRRLEQQTGSDAPGHNGSAMLGWPDFQKARAAVVFSTLYVAPERFRLGSWQTLIYRDPEEAHRQYRAQLDVYHRWAEEHPDRFTLIRTKDELAGVMSPWRTMPDPDATSRDVAPSEDKGHPVGLVVLMEGAEGVRHVEELELWWELGVRIIGPAWSGTRFCGGTGQPGPLTPAGYELLDGMADHGFILDLSHMDEQAALQALDHYPGRIIASHANAKALLKGSDSNRHLSDRVIEGLIAREGCIGVVPFNTFLKAGWKLGDPRAEVTLHHLAAHIDHICQIAGSSAHVGIGSDFEGGFGVESTPDGLETIADLHALAPLLADMGYSDDDIAAVFGGNWHRMLETSLPETV